MNCSCNVPPALWGSIWSPLLQSGRTETFRFTEKDAIEMSAARSIRNSDRVRLQGWWRLQYNLVAVLKCHKLCGASIILLLLYYIDLETRSWREPANSAPIRFFRGHGQSCLYILRLQKESIVVLLARTRICTVLLMTALTILWRHTNNFVGPL